MNMFENLSLKMKLGLGFAIPLVLFTIISVVGSQTLSHLIESQKTVDKDHKIIEKGDELFAAVTEMESGLRGYLITGRESYLEPYREGKQHFDKLIEAVAPLIQDDSAQTSRIDQVRMLERSWQSEHFREAINLHEKILSGERPLSTLTSFVTSSNGPVYMEDMRKILQDFIAEERKLIAIHQDENSATASFATTSTYLGSGIAILIGIIAAALLTRNITRALGGEPSYAASVATKIAN
ncbi:CHASE3 domain-containing protein, partial [Oleiphilus sp. HI0080]